MLDDTGSFSYNPSTGNFLITGGSITINDGQADILTISNSGNILTDKKIGTATNQEYIDFSTSNEVNVKVNNTEKLSVTSSGVDVTGNLSVSGSYGLSSGDIPNNSADTTGNADTATKIASITNSDIVQLTSSQTLTNKTLTTPIITSPTITGTGTIAGAFTGDLTGNASTATALQSARTIHGVSFDGSENIDLSEEIQDTVGAMFSNNTETNITATYQDSDGTIDLAVSLPFSGLSDVNIGLSDADKFLSINGLGTGLTFVSQIPTNKLSGTITNSQLAGSIANSKLADSTISGVSLGDDLTNLTVDNSSLQLNTGTTYNGSAARTISVKNSGITNAMLAGSIDLTSKVTGSLPIANGGTGATSASAARTALGVDASGTRNTTDEIIQDVVGAMFSSNTETGITATYQDDDGTIDLVVGTLNQDTTGNAATATVATKVTITDNENTDENNAIIFAAGGDVDGGNLGLESDGNLTYNPSTGKITATGFIGDVTGNTSGSSGSCTGNSATATALQTARTIGGVSFDGTENINLPGVNTSGNQNTSGNAATATLSSTVTITNSSTNSGPLLYLIIIHHY